MGKYLNMVFSFKVTPNRSVLPNLRQRAGRILSPSWPGPSRPGIGARPRELMMNQHPGDRPCIGDWGQGLRH